MKFGKLPFTFRIMYKRLVTQPFKNYIFNILNYKYARMESLTQQEQLNKNTQGYTSMEKLFPDHQCAIITKIWTFHCTYYNHLYSQNDRSLCIIHISKLQHLCNRM